MHASVWKRFWAFVIDVIVFAILFWALAQLIDNFTLSLLLLVIIWLYYALLESSPWQASLGKRLLGLKVVDKRGRRLSFGKATKRLLSRLITNFTFYFGFFSAAFDKQNKTLHDRMSKSLVVEKDIPFDPDHFQEEDEPVFTFVTVVSVLLALIFVSLLVWWVVLPQYQRFDAKVNATPITDTQN
ncbi:MAG: RDD family protein [Elusimicrobiaceae bacterium]|nr:RDD family protein [Elusimicrobiaceae bacterium]